LKPNSKLKAAKNIFNLIQSVELESRALKKLLLLKWKKWKTENVLSSVSI